MALLFIVALVLAWPTFGLSLVAFFAYSAFVGYARGKEANHRINQAAAIQDAVSGQDSRLPTWASDPERIELFVHAIVNLLGRKGVAKSYPQVALQDKQTFILIFSFAAQMERRGSSFAEQQIASADLLERMWQKLDGNSKEKFFAASA